MNTAATAKFKSTVIRIRTTSGIYPSLAGVIISLFINYVLPL